MKNEKNINIGSNIESKLLKLPNVPWIYKMLSEDRKIIYIWKAKNLKKRVLSYFQNKDHPIRTQKMIENTHDLEWIEVNSELEALILETNLIKELMPKYNILMKDWKNFSYLKITINDKWPRLEIVKQIKKDWSIYYWPKTSNKSLEDSVKILQEIYPIVYNNIYRINWYPKKIDYSNAIKNLEWITNEEYMIWIKCVMDFFEWKYEEIHKKLYEIMMKYANERNFESATKIRDYLNEFKKIHETQIISEPNNNSQDVFWYKEINEKTYVTLFQIRNWKLIWNENLIFDWIWSNEEFIESLITQYYENTWDYPKEIILPISLNNLEEKNSIECKDINIDINLQLEKWFEKKIWKKIKVILPQKGKKSKLIDLANKNAESFANIHEEREWKDKERLKKAFSEINNIINIEWENNYSIFKRMECFDISHFWWTNTVASMSVFTNWIPDKKEYRHYNIQSLENWEIDDFKSIYEVIDRRLKKIEEDSKSNWIESNNNSSIKFTYEKLTKKTLKKYSEEKPELFLNKNLNSNTQVFIIKNLQKIIWLIDVINHNKKNLEINFESLNICNNENNLKISNLDIIKSILFDCNTLFPEKQIWIWDNWKNENTFLEYWFKKLKTINWDLKEDKWLLPEEIANNSNKTNWIYLCRTTEKILKKWEIPTLILIDWGKWQLSSAYKAFIDNWWIWNKVLEKKIWWKSIEILLISIAKQNEEIFWVWESKAYELKNNSEWSFLLQRLRDEAHRFWLSHQQSRRDKKTLSSWIDKIPWIWDITKFKLLQKFWSIKWILNANDNELLELVNKKILNEIRKI